MKRVKRLVTLIVIGILASSLVIFLANFFIVYFGITDIAPKGSLLGAVLTCLGVIFSAVYKEISSYYSNKDINASKKWDMIFPFIKNHYNPWINSAQSLEKALSSLDRKTITDNQLTRILFLITVFYGRRLTFILKDGGLILLSSFEDEEEVTKAYRDIEIAFPWGGIDTPNRVSELQHLFISKDKDENPYVLFEFEKDLNAFPSLKQSRDLLKNWLAGEGNIVHVSKELNHFISKFKTSIHKLYKVWDE